MAKLDAHFFKHDYSAKDNDKMLNLRAIHGAEGYGIYWMLVESMFMNNGALNLTSMAGLSLSYGVAICTLSSVVDCCVDSGLMLKDVDDHLTCKRVQDCIEERRLASEYGKKGAKKRWHKPLENKELNSPPIAPLCPPQATPNAEESIEEDRIEENIKEKPFKKPTPEEVTAYAKEIDFTLDGSHFVDYYESAGWKMGKRKVKDWKACVRTWKRNDKKRENEERVKAEAFMKDEFPTESSPEHMRKILFGTPEPDDNTPF